MNSLYFLLLKLYISEYFISLAFLELAAIATLAVKEAASERD